MVLVTLMGVLTAVAFAFVFGFFVMLLWNWLIPDIFYVRRFPYTNI